MDTNTLALASIGAGLQLVPRAPHLPQHRGGRSCSGGANYHRALRVVALASGMALASEEGETICRLEAA